MDPEGPRQERGTGGSLGVLKLQMLPKDHFKRT